MANWCLNTVTFEADETVMEKIRLLFIEMAEKEILTNKGQLPEFYSADTGYLFEIDCQETQITYLTKWSPNFFVMVGIAFMYGADFVHHYEELNMGVYGMAIYKNRVLHDIYLRPEDFGLYDYEEQSGNYAFEGKHYKDDAEILEILLQRKINKLFRADA